MAWKIIYYRRSPDTESPVMEFLESLDTRAYAKIDRVIACLREYGINTGPPYVKKVSGTKLWELRVLGQDNIRIFYVAHVNRSFVLLHGFIKKKQKTDKKEIKTALIRLTDITKL